MLVVVSNVVDINKTGMNETVSSGCDVVCDKEGSSHPLRHCSTETDLNLCNTILSRAFDVYISMAEVTAMDFL